MTTVFPASLDTFVDPTPSNNLSDVTVLHSTQHANINDSVAAIETKVGVDSSAVVTTIDFLLKNTASINPGHQHTGSSLSTNTRQKVITAVINGNGLVPSTGVIGYAMVPYAGTITESVIIGNVSGSAVVDVWKVNNAIPTISNTIGGQTTSYLERGNNFFNNGTDVTSWLKDSSDVSFDPMFANVSEVTGTTANSSGSVLTDTSKNFVTAGVTANVDFLHVTSGTGATVAVYMITAVTTTTLTVNNAIGTSSSNNLNYWITVGHNFTPTNPSVINGGFPTFANQSPATTSFPAIGAVQNNSVITTGQVFVG